MIVNRKAFLLMLVLGCGLNGVVGGCGRDGEVGSSNKRRDRSPKVEPAELSRLVADNSAFAFDLYGRLSDKEVNLVLSPYSLSVVLGMTYAGARGETERQMANVLHFTLGQDRLHPAFNALDLDLSGRTKSSRKFQLNVANALWAQRDCPFSPAFFDQLAANYGAGVRLVDFIGATEPARVKINEWVSRQTEGKINDLLAPGILDPLTRLVLTNAIYFKGKWEYPFEHEMTHPREFTLLSGEKVMAPMMAGNPMGMKDLKEFPYTEGDDYQAVELPYKGGQIAMVVVLPKEGQFKKFEAGLTGERLAQITGGFVPRKVELHLPKFQFDTQLQLTDILSAMGMPSAFGGADFSGMGQGLGLFIKAVVHQAKVLVDEEGTEAAAASAVIMSSHDADMISFDADRPFVVSV